MDSYKTQSTSQNSARLIEPIVIEEKQFTRKVLMVDLNDAKVNIGETVGIIIIHQRKNKKEEWEDVHSIRLSSLKGGEGVKLHLDSHTTRNLYDQLSKLYALVKEKGIQLGTNEFSVAQADEIIKVDQGRRIIIERLLSENYGVEIWNELISKNPDLATKLSFAKIHTDRCHALKTFEENLEQGNNDEGFWQRYFMNNEWIFGYGLNYQFLNILQEQPNYGGSDYTGKGAQKGDYLLSTEAAAKFTVLVEIKTPVTNIFSHNKKGNPIEIRNDTWLLSGQLLGAVSQIQVNTRTWSLKSQNPEDLRKLESQQIYTVEPKGILVIGNLGQLNNHEGMLSCFESFRRNIKNPEILTFDELYQRASFILQNQTNAEPDDNSEDDPPF